nr:16S rRNA (guanine(527)-N(7))-methyltransferase RsmG [Nakamurella flavida]
MARRYVELLATEGVIRGLIGPREPDRLWSRHVLNSAVLAEMVPDGAVVVDIGSGAGLPGIPLVLAHPTCRVVLVEPLARRVQFLTEVVEELGLDRCTVIRGRADEVIDACGGADVVTSRAVAPLAKLATWSAPLLRLGGELMALKGSSAAEEIDRDRSAVGRTGIADLRVRTVGLDIVDPPTLVVHGRMERVAQGRRGAGRGTRRP